MNPRWCSIGALGAAATVLIGACSLDERTLHPQGSGGGAGLVGLDGGAGQGSAESGAAGAGGTIASPGGSGGSGGGGNSGADAGAPPTGSGGATDGGADTGGGGAGGAVRDPCVYGGAVVMPGCETLVPNPGFATTVAGWEPEQLDVTAVWDASDAQGSSSSGSLAVTNRVYANTDGTAMAGARRCFPTTGGLTYDVVAALFIAGGQGQGSGAIGVFFYDSPDCSGTVRKSITSSVETTADTWKLVELHDSAPATAKSMLVRLAAVKLFRQASLIVRFDNIFVQARLD